MLEWLLTVTAAWTDFVKQQMLNHAGWCDKLDAALWLKAHGLKWPLKFAGQYTAAFTGVTVHQCWSLAAVQWAVASGSGWLDWHCEDYAADNFSLLVAKQNATAVLECSSSSSASSSASFELADAAVAAVVA
jgi:hypothetical protein